jgi:hypothetical protein
MPCPTAMACHNPLCLRSQAVGENLGQTWSLWFARRCKRLPQFEFVSDLGFPVHYSPSPLLHHSNSRSSRHQTRLTLILDPKHHYRLCTPPPIPQEKLVNSGINEYFLPPCLETALSDRIWHSQASSFCRSQHLRCVHFSFRPFPSSTPSSTHPSFQPLQLVYTFRRHHKKS